MGRSGRSAKMYGKVVSKDSADRPGWKGPSYQKPKVEKSKAKVTVPEGIDVEPASKIPPEMQQLLVNIFKDAFPETLGSNDLLPLLQEIKQHLYERDFDHAFGKKEYLEAYAVRWSPSRALCYQTILIDIYEHLIQIPLSHDAKDTDDIVHLPASGDHQSTLPVICIGGGAAEVVAFGGLLRYQNLVGSLPANDQDNEESIVSRLHKSSLLEHQTRTLGISLLLLDVASWQDVVQTLYTGLISPPTLSKYASASAKQSNAALLGEESLSCQFRVDDVLTLSHELLKARFGKTPLLITLLFTLNELYTSSMGKTTAFLLNLTTVVKPGSLLFVVDSPGSYSETTVGSEAKKYPMQWLLDHTLLESQRQQDDPTEKCEPSWTKVVSEDSKWFRLPDGLRYPISLENMRYQVHLYRRL